MGERIEVGRWASGACGCIWVESRPAGFKMDPAAARVCSMHRHTACPESLYPSPQGMAMALVTYSWEDPR